jgi:mono/diheme cytochrome c family protein
MELVETRSKHGIGMVSVVALLALACIPAAQASNSPAKTAYLKYCGACHGASGKGDGVVSQFFRPKPTDLTQIAKINGGQFPATRMMQAIDGTKTIRAHGDPDMPVWGEVFRDDAAAGFDRRARVQGRVMLITDYIRSIQEQ